MQALQFERFGEPAEVIRLADVEDPVVPDGFVRVRVRRSPIHNHDLATIRGVYGAKPTLPAIGGTEFVGTTDDGKRVAAMTRGAWAEFAIAPVDGIVPVPDSVGDDAAAQLLAMPLSAVVLFEGLEAQPGDWIVQNAANGLVGKIVMRLARQAGVNVVGLVRRQDAAEDLAAYGAEHVVVTSDHEWPQRVREIVGSGAITRVIDSVCDAGSMALNRLLAPNGEHVVFGALGGRSLTLDPGALIFGETRVRGFWMTTWMQTATLAQRLQAIGKLFSLALSGELPLPVGGVYPLNEAAAALQAAETPGRPGKILFSI